MEGLSYLTGAPTYLLPISSAFMASLRACKFQILTRNSKTLFLPNAHLSVKSCCTLNHAKASLAEDDEEFEEVKKGKLGEAHSPVLLKEVLKVFEARPLRSFVDCTLGAAGHSSAIIKAHPELQVFIGLDVDPAAHEQAKPKLQSILDENQGPRSSNLRLNIVCNNFKEIKSVLGQVDKTLLVDGVDGIVMDLGMSSMQLDNAERGFSVLYDGPLDMRMDPTANIPYDSKSLNQSMVMNMEKKHLYQYKFFVQGQALNLLSTKGANTSEDVITLWMGKESA